MIIAFIYRHWRDAFDYIKAIAAIWLAHINELTGLVSFFLIVMKTYYLIRDNRKPKPAPVESAIVSAVINMNPRFNPITSLMGALMIVISIGMFIVPMFYEVKDDLNYWIPVAIGVLGISLLLIPDDVKGALKKLLNRKSEEL